MELQLTTILGVVVVVTAAAVVAVPNCVVVIVVDDAAVVAVLMVLLLLLLLLFFTSTNLVGWSPLRHTEKKMRNLLKDNSELVAKREKQFPAEFFF